MTLGVCIAWRNHSEVGYLLKKLFSKKYLLIKLTMMKLMSSKLKPSKNTLADKLKDESEWKSKNLEIRNKVSNALLKWDFGKWELLPSVNIMKTTMMYSTIQVLKGTYLLLVNWFINHVQLNKKFFMGAPCFIWEIV